MDIKVKLVLKHFHGHFIMNMIRSLIMLQYHLLAYQVVVAVCAISRQGKTA